MTSFLKVPILIATVAVCFFGARTATANTLNSVSTSTDVASEIFTIDEDRGQVYLNFVAQVSGVGKIERRWNGTGGGCFSPMVELDTPTFPASYKYRVDACSSGVICKSGQRWINFEARRRVYVRPQYVGGMDHLIVDQEIFGKPGTGYGLGSC